MILFKIHPFWAVRFLTFCGVLNAGDLFLNRINIWRLTDIYDPRRFTFHIASVVTIVAIAYHRVCKMLFL